MLTVALIAIAVSAQSAPQPHCAARDSLPPISVILEVHVGAIAASTVRAVRSGDTALLPVAAILALAELRPNHGVIAFLSTDSLSVVLHAVVSVDWDDLTVMIGDDGTLPVSRRVAREQRRRLFNATVATSTTSSAPTFATPTLPHNLFVDYDVATSTSVAQSRARLSVGTNILGGALDLESSVPIRRPLVRPTISWERDWPESSRLRHLRIGSIPLRRASLIGSGVFLSSESSVRADDLEFVQLAGALASGWELEAYRNDVLVYTGLADSIGSYAVNIPTSRGANRLTIAAHGPFGDQRVISRYVSIGDDMIPAGTNAYDLTVGRCEAAGCGYGAELRARHAPIARVTTGVSLGVFTGSPAHSIVPSALLSARLRDDVNMSVHYSRDDATGDIRFAPSPELDMFAKYRRTLVDPRSSSTHTYRSSFVASAVWRPRADRPWSATIDFHKYGLDQQRLRIGTSLSLGSMYVRPFASMVHRRETQSAVLECGLFADSPALIPFPVGSHIRIGIGEATNDFVSLSIPFARVAQLETRAEWLPSVRIPGLTVSVRVMSGAVRYEGHSVTERANSSMTHAFSGSIILTNDSYAGSRFVSLSSKPSRGRAELMGRVFLDGDANGVLDAQDQLLQGVSILIGNTTVETDSTGEYHLADVMPFTSVVVSADSLTLPSPNMIAQPVRVVPLPNGVTRVDLPVTLGASGHSVCGVGRLTQDAQRGDPSSIDGDHFETCVRDANPVSNPREPAQSREHIAPQC